MHSQKKPLPIVIVFLQIALFSCSSIPKVDKAIVNTLIPSGSQSTNTIKAFSIDTSATTVRFTGYGPGHSHAGIFKLKEGAVKMDKDSIIGGTFIIDIPSMNMEQKTDAIEHKLRPHLLSSDFFDVNQFPTALFEITKVEPFHANHSTANYLISGNLTLKNVTKNISFPAKLTTSNNALTGTANFNINRTWWNLNYGSSRSLGNKFISEIVNIQLNIKAAAVAF